MFEKFFKLKERSTTVRTEVVAGLTTFFAMAYIIFVNPNMLQATGMEFKAVMMATCISAAIGTLLTALIANVPFAQAPGMGLNAFFTYTVCLNYGYTWQQGLTIVLISGLIFLLITVTPLRSKVIASIPMCLKNAISVGIGLFITFVGLLNSGDGIVGTTAAGILELRPITSGAPLLMVIGLIITGALMVFKVKGAIFIGIIATTLIGIPMGVTAIPESITTEGLSLAPTFLQFDFGGLTSLGVLPLITAILSFTLVDMFDTVGTLIGTAARNDMLDKDGNLPGGDRALIADAIATCVGACMGTSTVTTFVESSTGISEGGRTGLSSVVVSICFLLATLFAPIAGIVPGAATAPALIIVGVLMMGAALKIDWLDFETALPCFMTVIITPFAYSISDGIAFGFIFYVVIKLLRGKAKEVPVLTYLLSAIFVLNYILKFI